MSASAPASVVQPPFVKGIDLLTVTIQGLQRHLSAGTINSVELVTEYLRRIEADNHQGLKLGAVIEVAPWQKLRDEARRLDDLRMAGVVLSELHGVPLLIKDSIATEHDLGMETTAGSFALKGSVVPGDATVVANLRRKGAIIFGKANLTEFSGITGEIQAAWSGRGGVCFSAYVPRGDPSGSSGGSAVGTSAGFAAAALGGDTTGSITFPASKAACFSIRPTVGLVSTSGGIPLAEYLDTLGPIAKSTYDAALLLTHMVGPKQIEAGGFSTVSDAKPPSTDYTQYTQMPFATFQGKKLGVPRRTVFDDVELWKGCFGKDDLNQIQDNFDQAIAKMQVLGAVIEDPADMISLGKINVGSIQKDIITNEFKGCFEAYLGTLKRSDIKSLRELIAYKEQHPENDIPEHLAASQIQRFREMLNAKGPQSPEYLKAVAQAEYLSREEGVTSLLDKLGLDALIVPADHRELVRYASMGGLPIVSVPSGVLRTGQPFGMCFVGRKGAESTLIALM